MKKLVAILALVLFAGSTAFAGLHDHTTPPTGTGTFTCTVWEALKITVDKTANQNLGTFVISATPYTGTDLENNVINFTITGHATAHINYTITEDETDEVATIVVDWYLDDAPTPFTTLTNSDATLDADGIKLTAKVSSLTALKAGDASFAQTVTASYNSF